MNGKCFFDTNVLVYSFQTSEEKRSLTALDLVTTATEAGRAVISFQVVQEFFSVAFRKSVPPMKTVEAKFYLDTVMGKMQMVQSSNGLYGQTLTLKERYRWGWYDSLIVAAALEGGCGTLYTEDLHNGQMIEGMMIVNPFIKS
jgi:predicted nucleic acid-binding protein